MGAASCAAARTIPRQSKAVRKRYFLKKRKLFFIKDQLKHPAKILQHTKPHKSEYFFSSNHKLVESTSQSKPPPLRLFSTKVPDKSWGTYSFSTVASIGVPSAAACSKSRRDLENVTIATPVKISAAATACVTVSTARPSRMLTKAATMGCT